MKNIQSQRILILPDAGPENPFQYQIIEFLRSHGFEVFTGSNRKLGSIYKAVNQSNPEMIYFDWVHSYLIGKTFLWSFIKSIVFISEIFYLRFIKKIPILHTLHNTQNHGGFWLLWERIVYGFFLRKCSKIRVYSETVRQEVVKKFKVLSSSLYVIQDIPYHYYYPDYISKKESKDYFNVSESDFVFLFFGKIKEYKGLENLIRAFINVKKPDDYLFIAGECLDKNYILELGKLTEKYPEIIWHDKFIAKNEIQYFFNAADVVVLPFTRIDHSGSIDLAMSFRKPIITLKTGATSDLLAHQNPLLFEDFLGLASCMTFVHNICLNEIGQKNFEKADSTNYSDLLLLFQKE